MARSRRLGRTPLDRRVKVLVTGGGGFLGRAIADRLLQRGYQVRSYARGNYPALAARGVETVRGDLADAHATAAACAGCQAVVHAAALIPGMPGPAHRFHTVNVAGTEAVIAGCRAHGVRRLVFASSPSVVFDGSDLCGVDESVPYPHHYHSPYSRTKALAEQAVLAANDAALATVALRPHLIWGPGDRHLVPALIARARRGRLAQIGRGPFRIDVTYIDSAAEAHVLAIERLAPGARAAGRAYFISQGEPVDLWQFVGRLLKLAGVPPVRRRVPRWLALAAAGLVEGAYGVLRPTAVPPLTRFLVREISSSHWFDIGAARRDLGYEPPVSIAEGLHRLARSWAEDAAGGGHGTPAG